MSRPLLWTLDHHIADWQPLTLGLVVGRAVPERSGQRRRAGTSSIPPTSTCELERIPPRPRVSFSIWSYALSAEDTETTRGE
jgi:hypothetical protein